jgi:hypothetical protein
MAISPDQKQVIAKMQTPDAKAQGQTWCPGNPKTSTMPSPIMAMKLCSTVSDTKRSALLLTITFQPACNTAANNTIMKMGNAKIVTS